MRAASLPGAVCAACLGFLSAQTSQLAPPVELGEPIERQMHGGEAHDYRLDLAAGQYVHVVVDQLGIDVIVSVFGPDGKTVTEVDSPNGRNGPEPVYLVSEASGTYRLRVWSQEEASIVGRYVLRWQESRPAGDQERATVQTEKTRLRAQLAAAKGDELLGHPEREAQSQAIQELTEASKLFESIQETGAEALALNGIGSAWFRLQDYSKAIAAYQQALALRRRIGDQDGEARTLGGLGAVYVQIGDSQTALQYLKQSQAVLHRTGDRKSEATTLDYIGRAQANLGLYQDSLDSYKQALALRLAAGDDRLGEAISLNDIGNTLRVLGQYEQAIESHDQALEIVRALKHKAGEASVLNGIGMVLFSLGEIDEAKKYFEQTLEVNRDVGDKFLEATALHNLGTMYLYGGETGRALEFFEKALPLRRAVNDRVQEIATLNNIGVALTRQGREKDAVPHLQEALALSRKIGSAQGEAATLTNTGRAQSHLGQAEEARQSLQEALKIERSIGDRRGEIMTLVEFSRLERSRGNLAEALALAETGLAATESLRSGLRAGDWRAALTASSAEQYGDYVGLLLELSAKHPGDGYAERAFEASERYRARSLLETLRASGIDPETGAASGLAERRRALSLQLDASEDRRVKLRAAKAPADQIAALDQHITDLEREMKQVESALRQADPRYTALMQPEPLRLNDIRRETLDENTVLLEYMLGPRQSHVWAVAANSFSTFELPGQDEIGAAARGLYELLTSRNRRVKGETAAARQARIAQADARCAEEARALGQMLLAPVGALLRGKRLLIVADGLLHYIPFSVLGEPAMKDYVPLMAAHEIVNVPSATVLAEVRREASTRARPPRLLAVLADPVFDANDPRVRARSDRGGTVDARLSRSAIETDTVDDQSRFPRLPFTRDEADAIYGLAMKQNKSGGFKALDFNASLATATAGDLAQYRVVHFATHGLLNSEHPELSGLVLSLVNEQGKPQPGFLRLQDIYNLRMPADLVTLSACQTGLGKEIKAEGLVGLTRGFLYAGAQRVLASVWKVDDAATSVLMERFYRGMLMEGKTPASALRQAQIKMWRQSRWRQPYYWAAFHLQGEWR